ncbi:protein kinase domain-containing protein [Crateriforma conspicua]|uniref:Serine/threonine-protein kinase PknB n=1 Tax=Crateriforma conspicua TaxID=2527996 RepID=A0A5C5Y395_9PLAN|nr:protein kinase [Crateriforma conspicua]QDV63916.1 Serine/threonine-protein kinase PknB [Crateriforma conspicua]TWT69279.1 Serine/threonine-protein kinase PknB [Crateriforma conspicua]
MDASSENLGHSDDPRGQRRTGAARRESLTTDFSLPNQAETICDETPPVLDSPRYEICGRINRGGMGIIYRARDLTLCRDVVVKVLRQDRNDQAGGLEDFQNESQVISYLSHPGVIPIYDRGRCNDGRPYHVLKLVDGKTLGDVLRQKTMPRFQLLNVFADICETMAFAHSKGIIHLDLKPSNVMVGPFGEVHVMDWGLAHYHSDQPNPPELSCLSNDFENRSRVRGTPEYMAPEQAGGGQVGPATDVFGLGAILCEILTGHPPYEADHVRIVYQMALDASQGQIKDRLRNCDCDPNLRRLAIRCMASSSEDRPADALEVAQAVADYHETALEQLRSDMNRFFELSLDLFCIADFQGFFQRINGNFSRLLGYDDHELKTRPFIDFVHPEDREKTRAQMSVLDRGKPVVRFRNRYQRRDGRYVVLEWTAKAIRSEGVIFAVARDVTELT